MADDDVTALLALVRVVARRQWAALVGARAEIALTAALLGGWALVTLGVARVLRPDVVWPLSAGLLLLALCGAQWLGRLAWEGLYQLTRDEGSAGSNG